MWVGGLRDPERWDGMADARYRLRWPKELFLWEARRVNALPDDVIVDATALLLQEAFDDPAVAEAYRAEIGALISSWTTTTTDLLVRSKAWLTDLMADDSRLIRFAPPRYYAEREGHASAQPSAYSSLVGEFAELLLALREQGYFPTALPRDCVDDPTDWDDVSIRASRAIRVPFAWNGNPWATSDWSDPLLYSLIEYFHDAAQRPRTPGTIHSFAGCGAHYGEHNAASGGAVYRWRVNELLDRHDVGLNLGKVGDERGRLVRKFGTPLDDAADHRAAEGADDPEDEVAHAIRVFRERGATATQKRGALVLLAGALEQRRQEVKVVLGKDEDVLFRIANEFGLRHRNDRQRMDYGDEFLDYMFSAYLSAVTLMEALERRGGGQSTQDATDPAA